MLGGGAGDPSVDRSERLEQLLVAVAVLGDDPLRLAATTVNALADADAERAVADAAGDVAIAEGAATDDGYFAADVLVVRHHLHQPGDVLGQHPVDGLEQFRLERRKATEVLVPELVLHTLDVRKVASGDLVLPLDDRIRVG